MSGTAKEKKGLSPNVKSVIVLTVICLIVTALLAVTNHITEPIIKDTRAHRVAESLAKVLPNSGDYNVVAVDKDKLPSSVQDVYYFPKDGSYAVVLATTSAYSNGDMGITVGIDSKVNIAGVALTSYMESKDFGQMTYPQQYVGKNAAEAAKVDTVSGVTYSSKAFRKAIADAFTAVELAKGGASQ